MLSSTTQIALVLLFSSTASILAQFCKLPSILFLLCFGLIAGPVTNILRPDQLFGDLLIPFVSISVGILLFEGGLTLHIKDLNQIGRTVFKLITIGMLVTFACTTMLGKALLGCSWEVALLLGAITVVSGPTVVMPLLRQVRPSRPLGAILRWEGILIDPVGVLLTVIVFEAILDHTGGSTVVLIFSQVVSNLLVGVVSGIAAGFFVSIILERHLLADHMNVPLTLTVLVGVQTLANSLHDESGLLAATLMGVYLTNRCKVHLHSIIEFNEGLRDILIGCLFILLGARVGPEAVTVVNWYSAIFLVALIAVVRPLAVFIACVLEPFSLRQKLFLGSVAPRGIVAASVASLISLRLTDAGLSGGAELLSYTFLVIIGTVMIYSISTATIASVLKVRQGEPQGVLILGAHAFARGLARSIQELGFRAVVVDTNLFNVAQAREQGLEALHGNILSEEVLEHLDFEDLGKFLALSSNDEANSLAAIHFSPTFGKRDVYQVAPNVPKSLLPIEKLIVQPFGRILVASKAYGSELVGQRKWEDSKAQVVKVDSTVISEGATPLLGVTKDSRLVFATTDKKFAVSEMSELLMLELDRKSDG